MISMMLQINEVSVTIEPVVYTCYGLGSCIGLFVSDRSSNVSGGAHIAVSSAGSNELSSAESLIEDMFIRLRRSGSSLSGLVAKLTGGAHVYRCSVRVGEMNTRAVVAEMLRRRVFISASDVGGTFARTARYNTLTRDLSISTSDKRTYTI
jgi:chemotaxis protein CheD